MSQKLLDDRDLEFYLYELLDTESLCQRPRYQEHNREIFDATLATAKQIATDKFANHAEKGDVNEPTFDGEKVTLVPETYDAWNTFAQAGFLAAHYDFEDGGMQLPEVILRTSMAYFSAANIATAGYPFLTIGAANLIAEFGNEWQKQRFLPAMQEGRSTGTMALTEANQGSALADIKTYAESHDDGSYRIFGSKMFISGGDNELADNITHMVLAKIKGAPTGVGGISLFIVPKFLVNEDGSIGERNDVALSGLLHKMGYRNTTSTVLSFGEKDGAVGYLVGKPHHGLKYMFQMMNEARIGVGMGAAILGYQGFNYSLDYARNRPQGRLPSNKDPESKQVNIVNHADVRRMLLAQKAYSEGGMALTLWASSLFEDTRSAITEEEKAKAFELLDLITPMVKSWPSRYGLKANELAIQVLGGSGYIREYPVERLYRDNRLNPIHEGTDAIHGLDLLGRKVIQNKMSGYKALMSLMQTSVIELSGHEKLGALAKELRAGLATLNTTTIALVGELQKDVDIALANATLYLDVFGRVLVSWLWLRQAQIAQTALETDLIDEEKNFYQGKIQAAKYYIEWELPEIEAQAKILQSVSTVCFDMQDKWF